MKAPGWHSRGFLRDFVKVCFFLPICNISRFFRFVNYFCKTIFGVIPAAAANLCYIPELAAFIISVPKTPINAYMYKTIRQKAQLKILIIKPAIAVPVGIFF